MLTVSFCILQAIKNCVYRRTSGNKETDLLTRGHMNHIIIRSQIAERESTPPHDTCCLATKSSGILTLPCTCIMGYKDHGLQAVPRLSDGTMAATGAGSPVKLAKLCTTCRPNKARKTVKERELIVQGQMDDI